MSQRRDRIDLAGALMLSGVSALLGLNQALVKLVNAGMNPVFQAGLRSAIAFLPVLLWAWWRSRGLKLAPGSIGPGVLCGFFFSFEFLLLFQSLDYTSVSRASVMFYTMPFWVAAAAHFLIPGEAMTSRKAAGLALAIAGVALALARPEAHAGLQALKGDVMALLAATGWAAIAITARTTALSKSPPEQQLLYQLAVSAPLLLFVSLFFGAPFREMNAGLWGIFAFQALGVVGAGFIAWFWLLSRYPAGGVASFAFLSPVFGVLFGWLIIGEQLTATIVLALALVAGGIWLVNTKGRKS
jgi:drug/metabolite transporter (DMT)-like permease